MGTYIHFTEEQKERANSVDLVEFLRMQGETFIPSGRDKRLKSNHSITIRGNEWFDHATKEGGLAIDFVQNFFRLSFPDAVTMLLGGEQGEVYAKAKEKEEASGYEILNVIDYITLRQYVQLTECQAVSLTY